MKYGRIIFGKENVHIAWPSRWHHRETAELLRLVSHFKDPTFMAGDFNSTPGQKIHDRIRKTTKDAFLERGWGLGATFGFGLPIRIDYIYISDGVCPTCGADLVETLPDPAAPLFTDHDVEFEEVFTTHDPTETAISNSCRCNT